MSDTYVSRVTGTEASDRLLHHCGTVSVCVDVECAMAERLLYCPECEIFWGQDEDYWGDDKTEWEIEPPAPQTNYVKLVAAKDEIISRMHGKVHVKDRLLSDAHRGKEARDRTIESLLLQIQELKKRAV